MKIMWMTRANRERERERGGETYQSDASSSDLNAAASLNRMSGEEERKKNCPLQKMGQSQLKESAHAPAVGTGEAIE